MTFKNAVSWVEIPTIDINRAQKFYETIFNIQLIPLEGVHDIQMRMFPLENMMGVGGALCHHKEFYTPSINAGPLVYLNANPDVQIVLDRIEAAGGQIITPKTQISPEYGHMAIFVDTEGNRMALHSVPQ
jgi:predicted enzyme related to lactoylglutathione lyase